MYWMTVKQAIDRTPDVVRARAIYKKVTEGDTEASTYAYQMATEQLDNMELLEQTTPKEPTQLTTPRETESGKLSPRKKKPGPCNPDQAAEFVIKTTKSINQFINKMHNYEPYAIEEGYKVLIAECHHALCSIEEYFKNANKMLVLQLIDNTSCKMLRMATAKDAEDREKCPDPRVPIENIMISNCTLNRLAAPLNFEAITGDNREAVCDLFNSLQMAQSANADISDILATLSQRLDPNQFQFLLKHPIHPLVQLQVLACLCNPAELKFTKQHLTDDKLYKQRCVNTVLPRPHHLDLDNIPSKHPTRALAGAIHYQLHK